MLRLYRQYLLARGNSLGTITQRIGDLHRLGPTFPDLLAVTSQDLEEYLARRARTWKPEYNKRIRTSLRIFYQWALREGRISVDPTFGLAPVRIPRALPRPAPDSVVLSAFDAGTLAERAMLSLAAAQGLRREEIASAHPANRVGGNLRVIGKNSDERVVPLDTLTASLLRTIEIEQDVQDYYFPGRFGGHLHPATVYKWLKQHLGPDWSTHNLRHRAATVGLDGTGDLRAVQELLGHRSISTTQLYTAVAPAQLQKIVDVTSLDVARARQIPETSHPYAIGANSPPSLGEVEVALKTLQRWMATGHPLNMLALLTAGPITTAEPAT